MPGTLANSELSARTNPALNDIFVLLEPFTKHPSESLRPLAREARMVLTARLASTSSISESPTSKKPGVDDDDDPKVIYQKALTLLQDPLLPVRAHGLLLLRQLASSKSPHPADPTKLTTTLDPALVPGVLSIFLQSIQDEDSYIFLNAVQGLAAMVDGFGKEVLRGLIADYVRGLDGVGAGALDRGEVDVRVRIGEALGQVTRRCGETLPSYGTLFARLPDRMVLTMLVDSGFARSTARKSGEVLPPPYRPSNILIIATRSNGGDECVGTAPLRHRLVWRDDRSVTVGKRLSDFSATQTTRRKIRIKPRRPGERKRFQEYEGG